MYTATIMMDVSLIWHTMQSLSPSYNRSMVKELFNFLYTATPPRGALEGTRFDRPTSSKPRGHFARMPKWVSPKINMLKSLKISRTSSFKNLSFIPLMFHAKIFISFSEQSAFREKTYSHLLLHYLPTAFPLESWCLYFGYPGCFSASSFFFVVCYSQRCRFIIFKLQSFQSFSGVGIFLNKNNHSNTKT